MADKTDRHGNVLKFVYVYEDVHERLRTAAEDRLVGITVLASHLIDEGLRTLPSASAALTTRSDQS